MLCYRYRCYRCIVAGDIASWNCRCHVQTTNKHMLIAETIDLLMYAACTSTSNLICAELGYPANFSWLGGAYIAPPPSNFRTNRRIEEGEATIESSQQYDSNAFLKFSKQGQMSGQGQVKGQSWLVSLCRLPRPDQRQL